MTPTPPAAAPAKCPACGAVDVALNATTSAETTYARCRACGEVWNAKRRIEERARPANPWGRDDRGWAGGGWREPRG